MYIVESKVDMMKKILLGIIIGGLIFGGIVYAASYYAKDVTYEPSDASWEVNNVNDAINDLYETMNNLNSSSDSTIIAAAISSSCSDSYNITPKVDEKYIELNGSVMTIKKDGNYNIYYGVYGVHTGSGGVYPAISLYINNNLIFKKNTYMFDMNHPLNTLYNVDLNEGDKVYLLGHAVTNVTCSLASFYIYK